MLHTLRVISVALGFVIVFGAAYLFFQKTAEAPIDEQVPVAPIPDSLPNPNEMPPLVVSHSYDKGTHTVSGVIMLPNPCYFLDVRPTVSTEEPPTATLTITTADEGGICVQVIDERPFSVEFEGPEELILRAVKDGISIPVSEDV